MNLSFIDSCVVNLPAIKLPTTEKSVCRCV